MRGSRRAILLSLESDDRRRLKVAAALRAESGNVRGAARRLGVGWSTLRRWIDADDELGAVVRSARNDPKKGAKG